MTLDTLLLLLARVTIVALIGRLLMVAMSRAAASTRYLIAVTTFCSMLAIPLISAAGWQWRVAWLPAQPAKASELAKIDAIEPPAAAKAVAKTTTTTRTLDAWRAWLLPALLAVAGILVARMLAGIVAIRWITVRAKEIEDDALVRDFDVAARSLGVERMVRLLASEHVTVPMLWGILRPALLLPAGALDWSRDRLRVVFAHELAHLRRGDAFTLLLTRAIAALYWFHPLAWSLDRAARRDCEQACDDLVLATGTRPSDYADHLLDIARSLPGSDPFGAVTLAMSRRSQLEGRLMSILQADARRGGVSRRASAVAAIVAALLVVPVATIQVTAKPNVGRALSPSGRVENPPHIINPEKAEDFYDIGKQRLHDRDYRGAIAAFSEAVRNDPFAGSAWYNLACAQALDGDRERALDTLENAILHGYGGDSDKLLHDDDLQSLHGKRLDAIAALADELVLKNDGNDWRTAIPRYARIAQRHPDLARAWFNYGFALIAGRQPREAIDVYDRVLAMDYRPGTSMYNLGCAYAIAGDRQNAINWLMKAYRIGFDVGAYAKGDRDLENVQDDRWLLQRIADSKKKKEK